MEGCYKTEPKRNQKARYLTRSPLAYPEMGIVGPRLYKPFVLVNSMISDIELGHHKTVMILVRYQNQCRLMRHHPGGEILMMICPLRKRSINIWKRFWHLVVKIGSIFRCHHQWLT
ncbi:hypothetical protein HanPSC8_Chr09g0370421 [Helianthus annuus]|nr:hypothetical protein HanPSC8_Chr09g0370421 [Helianthus annuus]